MLFHDSNFQDGIRDDTLHLHYLDFCQENNDV